ncbi:MAG: hypothetical protein ACOY3I_02155 [Verrucomicrobiota bacterium]
MADFNVAFFTSEEVQGRQLLPEETRLLRVAIVAQTLCWIGCGLAIVLLIAQAAYSMSRVYWKVNPNELVALKEQISQHNKKRETYASIIQQMNQRIRMDQVATPLLMTTQANMTLDSIHYEEVTEDHGVQRTIVVEGFSIVPDPQKVQSYQALLETSLQSALSGYKVNFSLEERASDPKSGNLRFSFKGTIQ